MVPRTRCFRSRRVCVESCGPSSQHRHTACWRSIGETLIACISACYGNEGCRSACALCVLATTRTRTTTTTTTTITTTTTTVVGGGGGGVVCVTAATYDSCRFLTPSTTTRTVKSTYV